MSWIYVFFSPKYVCKNSVISAKPLLTECFFVVFASKVSENASFCHYFYLKIITYYNSNTNFTFFLHFLSVLYKSTLSMTCYLLQKNFFREFTGATAMFQFREIESHYFRDIKILQFSGDWNLSCSGDWNIPFREIEFCHSRRFKYGILKIFQYFNFLEIEICLLGRLSLQFSRD